MSLSLAILKASISMVYRMAYWSKEKTTIWKTKKRIPLSESLFDNDALIFKNIKSRTIRLNPLGIEVGMLDHAAPGHLGQTGRGLRMHRTLALMPRRI